MTLYKRVMKALKRPEKNLHLYKGVASPFLTDLPKLISHEIESLYAAHRFELDDDFAAMVARVSMMPPQELHDLLSVTHLPFSNMWIECSYQTLNHVLRDFDLSEAGKNDDEMPDLFGLHVQSISYKDNLYMVKVFTGYSLEKHSSPVSQLADSLGATSWWPIGYVMGTNEGLDLMKGTEWMAWDAYATSLFIRQYEKTYKDSLIKQGEMPENEKSSHVIVWGGGIPYHRNTLHPVNPNHLKNVFPVGSGPIGHWISANAVESWRVWQRENPEKPKDAGAPESPYGPMRNHPDMSKTMNVLQIAYREQIGEARLIVALLGLMCVRKCTVIGEEVRMPGYQPHNPHLPKYEFREVTVQMPSDKVMKRVRYYISAHSPRRQHEVMGHWRTLNRGDFNQKRVWVRNHKRGNADVGVIEKLYHVESGLGGGGGDAHNA